MFTLLMDRVSIGERNSASALNFLVSFAGQAIAAAVAGRAAGALRISARANQRCRHLRAGSVSVSRSPWEAETRFSITAVMRS